MQIAQVCSYRLIASPHSLVVTGRWQWKRFSLSHIEHPISHRDTEMGNASVDKDLQVGVGVKGVPVSVEMDAIVYICTVVRVNHSRLKQQTFELAFLPLCVFLETTQSY